MRHQTDWQKRAERQNNQEEDLIRNSKFSPNEKVLFKNRIFKLNYPTVRNNELTWLAKTKQQWFWLPERLLV